MYKSGILSLRILLSGLYLSIAFQLYGQRNTKISDEIFGTDPLLYNGKLYTFFLPQNTGGSQYFHSPQFETGSVTIRGVTFSNLLLNYDVFNQKLVLKYIDKESVYRLLMISEAWLEKFSFRDLNFELIEVQDTLKRISQVIGTGSIRIIYFWEKRLSLDNFHGAKNHVFSSLIKEMNLSIDCQIKEYWNNKSFCILFGTERRDKVKRYLRENNVNVKKANDRVMTKVINYCNSLYEG